MTINETIAKAEALLPGRPVPHDEENPRWQAIIAIGEFVKTEPEPVWAFIER